MIGEGRLMHERIEKGATEAEIHALHRAIDDACGVRGGQGREPEDVDSCARIVGLCLVGVSGMVVGLIVGALL